MVFEGVDREIRRLIRNQLLQTRMARAIARKAGIRQGSAAGTLPQVLATFSTANSDEGYEIPYTTSTPFPNAVIQPDLTGISQARLVANVVAGGGEGVLLTASGASEDISVGLAFSPGDILSAGAWHPVATDGVATLSLNITAPGSGSVTVGLVQLQGI